MAHKDKEKRREYNKRYRESHQLQIKEYDKEYNQRPESKIKHKASKEKYLQRHKKICMSCGKEIGYQSKMCIPCAIKIKGFQKGQKKVRGGYIFGSKGKNPRWKGGISREPYDQNWTNKFKRLIRKRDNQICMLCGIHREKLKEALSIHHINHSKKLSIPQNGISLCRKCHNGIVHNDDKNENEKQNWIKLFQDKLTRLYDYQYSENQEVILGLKEKF